MNTTSDTWMKGTDLRNSDGIYSWPHRSHLQPGQTQEHFINVTTVLKMMQDDGFRFAEHYFAANEVAKTFQRHRDHAVSSLDALISDLQSGNGMKSRSDAADRARDTRGAILSGPVVSCWDKALRAGIERPVAEVLADTNWLKSAGPRGMGAAADRGSVVHDAVEAWVMASQGGYTPPSASDPHLAAWVEGVIYDKKSPILVSDCIGYVQAALNWMDEFVDMPLLAEAPVFNRTHNYAGTCDLVATLKGHTGVWLIDFKSSSKMTPRSQHKIQLSAYKNAEFFGIKDPSGQGTAELQPFPQVDRIGNVYICPDDRKCADSTGYRAQLREWESGVDVAFQTFVKLREVWQQVHVIDAQLGDTATIVKPPKSATALMSATLPRKRDNKKEAVAV